ncbi:hypothetical protein VTN77DRAFT_8849 [Rasamsonia byssochlamydoides]|uniref:uncharacterized protein n=1 Tax=Rasamsonia byssochlamydoides TaxID=89139 RepID=UPI003743DDFD
MLGDVDLRGLDSQLHIFIRDTKQHHDTHLKLLREFQELIERYRRLKSDYEEEKESREKYKKLARGQERNPFVLVLVDGDGYIFKDQHIKAGSEGGVAAAQALSDAIKELLQLNSDSEQCRVMVRVYSNLSGLSKSLSRAGLVGHEARSLAPFTASFTRAQDLFDFVDAGDKDGAGFKIRETFRLFVDNNQCKHIFFAGCHDVGYLSLLTPYRGKADRVTLIKAASFHPEFESLDLPVREIPSVFRSTPIAGRNVTTTVSKTRLDVNRKAKVCKYYPKGFCKYGSGCLNEHVGKSQTTDDSARVCFRRQEHPSSILPVASPETRDLIPINKDGDRLDPAFPPPPPEAWRLYQQRKDRHELCNKHHLAGRCTEINCRFDHSALEPQALTVLQFILKGTACSRGLRCRLADCYAGHVCQKNGCLGGSSRSCPFKPSQHMHRIDFKVAEWVPPVVEEEGVDDLPECSIILL